MKILVTVGTQLPFDRLIRAMDDWAARHPTARVFAQIGEAASAPRTMDHARTLPRDALLEAVEGADVIVAHAGIGSLLTALDAGKPLIVMPRRADLGEHRNDHQAATAAEVARFGTVAVVHDAEGLEAALAKRPAGAGRAARPAAASASAPLLDAVGRFIASPPAPAVAFAPPVARSPAHG